MKFSSLFILSICLISSATSYCQVDAYPLSRVKEKFELYTETHHPSNVILEDRDAGDLISSDDFSDFANWNTIALDGDPNWELVLSEPEEIEAYIGAMESTTEANGFALFNGIQYLIGDSVITQDAVLEYNETINCLGIDHVTLTFEQRYRAYNTDQTIVEVSDNNGVSYDYSYEINTDVITNGPSVQETVSLNIAEAAADKEFIKIRFRWIESEGDPIMGSGYGWMIDDFKLLESLNYEQEITASFHRSGLGGYMLNGLEYYQIPESQRTEIYFMAKTTNQGSAIQENLKLNVEVTGVGSFTGVSEMTDLPVYESDSMGCITAFTPEAIGDYTVKYWFDSDSTEEFSENDTIYETFEVTSISWPEGNYSRHNGVVNGSIQNVESNSGDPLLIGNVMEVFGEADFGSISFDISDHSSNLGKLVFGQVMRYNEETNLFVYVDQTEEYVINEVDLGITKDLIFEECITAYEGEVLLVLLGHYGGDDPVHFDLAQNVEEGSVLGYTYGATEPFYLENPQAIMVRLKEVYSSYCWGSISENSSDNILIDQNTPNPFSINTTINYTLTSSEDLQITFTDIAGKIIKTLDLKNQSAGEHNVTINANEFSEGIYFYTFTVGAQSITKRMIVTK